MDQLTVLPPHEAARKRALATLDDITRYVTVNRFSLSGLAHGLGRKGRADDLQTDLLWLVKEGYMDRDVSQIYSLTLKGRMYESPGSEDDASPSIEFISSAPVEPPKRDPRYRR